MKLKVCGMKYNTSEVAALRPDFLGFIFYDKSSRFFEGDIPKLDPSVKKVGVFVDASVEDILEKIETHHLQAVQLHGHESPEFCNTLRDHYEKRQLEWSRKQNDVVISSEEKETLEIIKVFSIKDLFDFSILEPYEAVCDYFLFDTKGKLPGGNGYTFDWDILNQYPSTKPFFLSGGIGPDQLENLKAFQKSKASQYCYAIDVNSQFEIESGLKKIDELEQFKNSVITRS